MTLSPFVPTYEERPVIGIRTTLATGRRIVCPTCNGTRLVQKPTPRGCPECGGASVVLQFDAIALPLDQEEGEVMEEERKAAFTPQFVFKKLMNHVGLPEDEHEPWLRELGLSMISAQIRTLAVLDEARHTDEYFEDRDEDVLPPGYYVLPDPECLQIFDPDDELAFTVTPNTSDHEINHLAWEYEIYGPTPAKESV